MHLGLGIKSFLRIILNRFIVEVGDLLSILNRIYSFQKIKLNRNINLGENVKISPTARIDTRFGGRIKIGNNTEILDGVLILTYGGDIEIGNNCSINPYTVIYGHGGTTIGDDVLIAGHSMIIPNNHGFEDCDKPIRMQGNKMEGIKIQSNVWIGHGCSILDGSYVEYGTVIGAGSVVRGKIEKNSIIAGIPAKLIKKRS